jgi:hypothetical protein
MNLWTIVYFISLVAHDLWLFVFSAFEVHWAMPKRVIDVYSCWKTVVWAA